MSNNYFKGFKVWCTGEGDKGWITAQEVSDGVQIVIPNVGDRTRTLKVEEARAFAAFLMDLAKRVEDKANA